MATECERLGVRCTKGRPGLPHPRTGFESIFLEPSETRRGRRTIRSNVTSRRASRRHDGRPRAPALNAAATVSLPSHSSPSPRRRVRRTCSRASNAGRPGIRKRRRGCTWTMSVDPDDRPHKLTVYFDPAKIDALLAQFRRQAMARRAPGRRTGPACPWQKAAA